MALPDLTGQNIENTYQRVLQTDGTVIYDGTGSVFLPISASYAVTASYAEYAVSASHEIIKEVSSSYADYAKESGLSTSSISASYALTASYALNSPDTFPYTGSAIITGSLTVTGSTEIQYLTASGLNYPAIDGGEKQFITTDGSGNLSFDWSDRTNIDVKNTSGITLPIGTPVYISGFQGASIFQIAPASASEANTMPSIGILDQTLNANDQGYATLLGAVRGVDTNGYSINQSLYVGEGILTPNRPTGSALIQKIARVGRVSNNGEITVLGAGRSNDIPNLQPGYAWVGDSTWNAIATPTSSFNEDPFPYTGSAIISGSLTVTGSISSTDTVTAVTGSFSHLKGNSPITVQDPVTFQHTQGLDVLGNATIHSINEVELQTISKDFNYTSSLNITEITSSVNGIIIDYRLTNLNSGSRVGTFMYAHDGTELSYNDLTIPGGGIGNQPILSASLVNDLVKIDIENAAGFNFTGYAKKFNKLANAIPVADPNINYVLNEYPSENVVGAYSIRQLDQFYTGSAMRIRRASDNSELDIEYDVNGYLDTLAIEAHCGGSVGHVTIWYDQSSNNRHLTQSTAANQPKIYDGTSIYEVNGQPCLRTRDATSNPVLGGVIGVDYTGGISVYNVANAAGYGQNSVFLNPLSNGWDFRHGHSGVSPGFRVNNKTAAIPNPRNDIYQILQSGFYDNSTSTIYAFLKQQYGGNFSPIQTGSATGASLSNTINSELQITTRAEYQELIIMNDYEISNREGIFTNINNYYNIYDTGLLAEYPGAAAAYSVRQLTTAYTGSALRIREDGTNTETDIGFDSNGDLDTASIASHCGANNGLVVTWYDQSGNGNGASQSTVGNQPKIYDGTTGVVTKNGKPTISAYDGGTVRTLGTTVSSDLLHTNNEFSQVAVFEAPSNGHVYLNSLATTFPHWRVRSGGSTTSTAATPTALTGGNNVFSQTVGFLSRSGNTVESYENNVLAINGTDTASITTYNASVGLGRLRYGGNVQELIIWNSDQSANRTGIETNINSYFNIYP